MKKTVSVILLFLLFTSASNACINYYYSIDKEGNLHETEQRLAGFNKNFNVKLIETELIDLEQKLKTTHAYKHLSDYAVYLMKIGKAKEALDLLAVLSYHYPDEYRIASNLGTAYELNGEVDSALKYIKRGLVLNPKDHEGSEWIHVKILETKLALRKDPAWLETHSVLQLSEKQIHDSLTALQIDIQVRERFPFSPGPNPIMASLFTDLGDCYFNTFSLVHAKIAYRIAKEYYGAKSSDIEKKIKETEQLLNKYDTLQPNDERVNIKLEGITKNKLIDDNDRQHYQVKWEKINTDVKALLALAALEPVPVNIAKQDSALTASKENKSEGETGTKTISGALILILLSIFVLAAGYFMSRK